MGERVEFIAEGMKNAIFTINTTDGVAKVIRVRKKKIQEKNKKILQVESEVKFYESLRQMIGEKYFLPIECIELDKIFEKAIEVALDEAKNKRSERFIKSTETDKNQKKTILMENHTLAKPVEYEEIKHNIFCIEIKPKSGKITKEILNFLNEENKRKIKNQLCNYCLRQLLKLKVGDVQTQSGYCPAELFSLQTDKVKNAILNLLKNPQNNYKMFYNGELVYTGALGCGNDEDLVIHNLDELNTFLTNNLFYEKLKQNKNTQKNEETEYFINLITEIILKEKELLLKIKEIIEKDRYSIKIVEPLYKKLISQDEKIFDDLYNYCLFPQPSDFVEITTSQIEKENYLIFNFNEIDKFSEELIQVAFKIIKDFLLSTTMKDCSIMLTLVIPYEFKSPFSCTPSNPTWSYLHFNKIHDNLIESEYFYLNYRLTIIDTDFKSPENIPSYAKLDNEIMDNAILLSDTFPLRNCNE